MPSNECIPYTEAAYTQKLTVHFTGNVTGKRFVGPLTTYQSGPALSATAEGGNLQCAGAPSAGGQVGGVAGWDVTAPGKGQVIRGGGTILPVMSGAAVTAGDELQVDASGRVIPETTGRSVGKAHSAVGGADLEVIVELYPIGNAAIV